MFGPAVAQRVIDFFTNAQRRPAVAFPQLTDRERDVLDLLAQGLSNPQIAGRLVISEKTVRNHVSNIFTKLAVADRAQAVIRAREGGLGVQPAYES
jgi:DNA-binding NarL/FixJ family response regulator